MAEVLEVLVPEMLVDAIDVLLGTGVCRYVLLGTGTVRGYGTWVPYRTRTVAGPSVRTHCTYVYAPYVPVPTPRSYPYLGSPSTR